MTPPPPITQPPDPGPSASPEARAPAPPDAETTTPPDESDPASSAVAFRRGPSGPLPGPPRSTSASRRLGGTSASRPPSFGRSAAEPPAVRSKPSGFGLPPAARRNARTAGPLRPGGSSHDAVFPRSAGAAATFVLPRPGGKGFTFPPLPSRTAAGSTVSAGRSPGEASPATPETTGDGSAGEQPGADEVGAQAAAEVAAEDGAEDAAEDGTEDAAEDDTKDAAEDDAKDPAEDDAKDAAEDNAKDPAEDDAEDAGEVAAPQTAGRRAESGEWRGIVLVTGTDTEVGKTIVTAAVAAAAQASGLRVAVIKPGQTGLATEAPTDIEVVTRLAAPETARTMAEYPEPMAPLAAANIASLPPLELYEVVDAIRAEADKHDLVLVEGAGGLLVPMGVRPSGQAWTLADLATTLGVSTIVVARAGLGTLNHTALTLEALDRRGVRAGVVIGAWPAEPELVHWANLSELVPHLLGALPSGAGQMDPGVFRRSAPGWLTPALYGVLDNWRVWAEETGEGHH